MVVAASRVMTCAGVLLILHAAVLAQPTAPSMNALDAFERGEWTDGDAPVLDPDVLVQTFKTLKSVAPGWVAAAPPGQQRRRRLAVATYVLQLLRSQEDPYLWQGGVAMPSRPGLETRTTASAAPGNRYRRPLPAVDLLEWACSFLRQDSPLVAERWWHLGAIALLERHDASQMLALHLAHARGRFPAEDRWVLGRAIAEDLLTWPEPRDDRPFAVMPAATATIIGRYEEAMARDSVREEAAIRLGYFELRRNRTDAALARFDQAGVPKDAILRYWLALFRGQALERQKRAGDAIASYQSALKDAPYAQSAVLALAAALVGAHRDGEAAGLVERALAMHPPPYDPWADYVLPDWRFWPRATRELRKAVTK
jgi:tetratricopeptide (TPR) repeat protein